MSSGPPLARVWPAPLSDEHEALRRCAAPLLRVLELCSLKTVSAEKTFELLEHCLRPPSGLSAKGGLELPLRVVLEAPIYSNHRIEALWMMLFELHSSGNMCRQVEACAAALGASQNFQTVIRGSRQLRAKLRAGRSTTAFLTAAGSTDFLQALEIETSLEAAVLPGDIATTHSATIHSAGLLDRADVPRPRLLNSHRNRNPFQAKADIQVNTRGFTPWDDGPSPCVFGA